MAPGGKSLIGKQASERFSPSSMDFEWHFPNHFRVLEDFASFCDGIGSRNESPSTNGSVRRHDDLNRLLGPALRCVHDPWKIASPVFHEAQNRPWRWARNSAEDTSDRASLASTTYHIFGDFPSDLTSHPTVSPNEKFHHRPSKLSITFASATMGSTIC